MKVACLPFVTHRAVGLAACSLLMLVLHCSLSQRVEAAGSSKPSGNVIRVWAVGSPFSGDLPQAAVPTVVQRQAEKLGYTIEAESFRAAGFAAKFRQALQEHTEPEILTFNNYGVVWGVTTPAGYIEGLLANDRAASSLVMVHEALAPLQPRGWVLLIRSAVNYEAAKALSMQPPVCVAEHGPATHSATQPELRQAQETAIVAARAYLACDQSSLSAVSDESRLGQKCFLPEHGSQVEEVTACGVFGNHNLAFVSLVGSFAAQVRTSPGYRRNYRRSEPSMALGHQSLLAVLRNQGGGWRLLTISDDPTNTTHEIPLTTPRRLGTLLDDGIAETEAPEPVQLLTADGVYPRPKQGQRFGDFIWRPSPNAEVVCEVAEFLVGDPSTVRERTRLVFLFGREGKLSSGLLWGTAARWRVWSINRGGIVTFSEQHSYAR